MVVVVLLKYNLKFSKLTPCNGGVFNTLVCSMFLSVVMLAIVAFSFAIFV